ncbi:sulfur carrier protein ThiS [Hyphococcus sp. DH-69]|uniref:sulfur carrier protein ThiS n=1 Tax=Hyphococcus formosus TaxID=3143534 RepID=UPI00398AC335
MDITINGEKKALDGPLTIAGLLGVLALEPRKIAVERNLEIVPKSKYDETPLSDGDKIEIVQFVGGG